MAATRKPANPVAAEALEVESTPVEYAGATYNVPPTQEWPYEVLEAFEAGHVSGFLRGLLGDAQHTAFKATKPKVADVQGFVEAIREALGISGN